MYSVVYKLVQYNGQSLRLSTCDTPTCSAKSSLCSFITVAPHPRIFTRGPCPPCALHSTYSHSHCDLSSSLLSSCPQDSLSNSESPHLDSLTKPDHGSFVVSDYDVEFGHWDQDSGSFYMPYSPPSNPLDHLFMSSPLSPIAPTV